MFSFIVKQGVLPLVAVSAALSAHAQTAGSAPVASSSATPPVLTFESAFTDYQAYTDQRVGSWKEANDTVGRIGGWRAYAKEASEPTSTVSPAATPPAGASTPHSGHGKH